MSAVVVVPVADSSVIEALDFEYAPPCEVGLRSKGWEPCGRSSSARLSAERRRCPKCNRKSALTYYTHFDQVIASCIYNSCDYESVTDLNSP